MVPETILGALAINYLPVRRSAGDGGHLQGASKYRMKDTEVSARAGVVVGKLVPCVR